ncbi:Scr1 family TA system antitoxin-like transcriptional regulator [Streptomyces lydicus]|uniref:Scr1 family TA system antitoxin-like transcriptional regulator n=1 Tax=Streptomyces lydicus TaxID=47763 RepID=UPI001F50F36A|nr:Scr1 family TA system antitoxin-like transcriptional regulator [Streptomyces lydicus]MCZ1009598.1 Scr1 family TA system antitoxin-like transcriptional regulator [Streptomyces lydicus]
MPIARTSTGPVSKTVARKLEWQAVLCDNAKRFTFLLTKQSMCWAVVPHAATAVQTDHLVSISHLPNVRIGVIPLGTIRRALLTEHFRAVRPTTGYRRESHGVHRIPGSPGYHRTSCSLQSVRGSRIIQYRNGLSARPAPGASQPLHQFRYRCRDRRLFGHEVAGVD